jgi:hypothetical protein
MKGMLRLTMALVFGLAAAACEAPPATGQYSDPAADFSRYSSFGWGESDLLPTGDARLDNNPFFNSSVRAALEQQLTAKGLRRTEAQDADLVVHYHVSISERMDVAAIDRRYSNCAEEGCEPEVIVSDEGTLMFDFVDARSQRLVWRGWIRGYVPPGILGDQAALDLAIRESVPLVLQNYPSRS